MSEIYWTTEHPTKPGYYWWKEGKDSRPYPSLRKVSYVKYTKQWIVSVYNSDEFQYLDNVDGFWAGPVPEPQEAKQ